ncbi:D-isomer specific 2-hydroxyacid dehydrogenase family protein [Haloferax sp. ATB1]|uniref:NAD(P)-dependent oxidoreductase n=1 Tax=Haloferax sp. ATB1 TaxID=1508454 RepID=UPI0005B1D3C3|nr:NAD(P)-dependent oxidoreductase [Haloferax sp. ATB1]
MPAYHGLVDRDIQPRDRLCENVDRMVDLSIGGPNDEDALIDALNEVDVVFTTSRLPLSAHVLESTNLDLIAKIGTGIDNIDLDTARNCNVTVTHTPGMNALSVAEHTVGLALAVTHRISETQDMLRAGKWRDEAPLGTQVWEKTVGLIGYGNVGRRVAKLLAGFEPRLLAFDPYVREIDGEVTGTELTSLERVLRESDVVCVTAELTPETRGLFGSEEFAMMKDSSVLVNTARGPIVQTDALVDALTAGDLMGAGLDVHETEPLPSDSLLHELSNVVTTPHTAAMTQEYRETAIDTLTNNALALLRGEAVSDEYLGVATDN